MPGMFDHEDGLDRLDSNADLAAKLDSVHAVLKERFPFLDRIACAIHDPQTDLLRTFLSSGPETPLARYQAKLAESSSLLEIIEARRPRVVNDLAIFRNGRQPHSRKIGGAGYRASYTMPMYSRGEFFGFVFFNSFEQNVFSEEVLHQIDPFGHLISLTIIHDLSALRTLLASVKTARDMMHARDSETGSHLDRMSRYARLIARSLPGRYGLDDETIEHIFVFSPLHDVGKIGIPDNILLKAGKLTEAEYEEMKLHASKGRELIDVMLGNFDLAQQPHIDVLRNIAELHHEAYDGSGYPYGRKGGEIPIEARIVAVADVFDALTSRRPYKEAWSNDKAFALLRQLSGAKLDPDCVEALIGNRSEVEDIQRRFGEDPFGA